MMKKTKKGVTLVELVICCAIIVMLGGACTAVLMSGQHVYSSSSSSANAQLDTDVLQTYMMKLLPATGQVDQPSSIPSGGRCLFFSEEGDFTVRNYGDDTTIRSVSEFYYKLEQAGASASARAQFVYKAVMNDGSTFTGGFIMNNMTYATAATKLYGTQNDEGYWDLKTYPFWFDVASDDDAAAAVTEPTT